MLGRRFGWLWASYAVSTLGTWLAFDAFPLVAILVLHVGPGQVSVLAAVGMAVGAVVAIPLGPWMEFRRKRPVLVGMDLVRFAAIITVPLAYAFGQLLVVSVVVAAADIAFKSASGAYLKTLVRPQDLLIANGRFESTQWTTTMLGPPLGGALIGVFGPMTTILTNAVSFVLSALGIRAIGGDEPRPARTTAPKARDLLDGWRFILGHRELRLLFFNTALVNSLIMATAPLLAVRMLGDLGFTPLEYGLAFGVPCVGGLIGSRLSRPLAARFGTHRILLVGGAARACWLVWLTFIHPGVTGLLLVIGVELALVTSVGIFNPVFATYRLDQTPADRVARTLTAWSVSNSASIAAMTALWGVLATLTSTNTAVTIAGALMFATPLLLPRKERVLT